MLVLTRKAGERLVIDQDIVVTVIHVEDGRVRLGIEAPSHVRVLRDELLGEETRSRSPRRRVLMSR
ncbi:MAG TPA: carbon storage regulator [Gemmataceae bacterium]|nr:carbon storage regulator [Gemmataceae bacterium]